MRAMTTDDQKTATQGYNPSNFHDYAIPKLLLQTCLVPHHLVKRPCFRNAGCFRLDKTSYSSTTVFTPTIKQAQKLNCCYSKSLRSEQMILESGGIHAPLKPWEEDLTRHHLPLSPDMPSGMM